LGVSFPIRGSEEFCESHPGEGVFDALFEGFPDLIGLAVSEFGIGGRAGEFGRGEILEASIERRDDIPDGDLSGIPGERVAASLTLGSHDQSGFPERLEDFMEVVFRHLFDTRKLMDGKFSAVFPERRRRPEAVIGFF
jgi:hypothetical protein